MSVKLTCALPMYRAKDIAWLQLESLCRQEDVDFDWELIVLEEAEDCFGKEKIKEFESRLSAVGCTRIVYKKLDVWIPLAEKWRLIGEIADSEGFLLVAADCYSQPKRLVQSVDLLQKYEWIQSPLGAFYNIGTQQQCIFDHKLCVGRTSHPCALNMGFRTEFVKAIPQSTRRRSIDGWLFQQITSYLNRRPIVGSNLSDDWKKGVDTHGLNNISVGRDTKMLDRRRQKPLPPFRNPFRDQNEPMDIGDCVPEDIALKLSKNILKKSANTRRFIRRGVED